MFGVAEYVVRVVQGVFGDQVPPAVPHSEALTCVHVEPTQHAPSGESAERQGAEFLLAMISAVLDNATLAAAEIGPTLTEGQIKSALYGLLIAGGMLIPGNIPNIIAAHSLRINSTEWAKLGVPLGLVTMTLTAILLWAGLI